jgi:hypothetical protein
MTDDDRKTPGIRRVGRKDRKKRLTSGPLFPADDTALPDDVPDLPDREPFDTTDPEPEADRLYMPTVEKAIDRDVVIDDNLGQALEALFPKERFPPLPDDLRALEGDPLPDVPAAPARRSVTWPYNLATAFFLLATVTLCGYYTLIWFNPYTALNPLAPPTPFLEVTWTPAPPGVAIQPPTATPTPDDAEVGIEADNGDEVAGFDVETPAPVSRPASGTPFALAEDNVLYIPNANARGCDWASIAGTVTGLDGQPLDNYAVQIIDDDDPSRLDVRVYSGSALTFGSGGFELPLGGAPVEGRYRVQLFSAGGAPVSGEYTISTRDSCDENVVVLNFMQVADL